ncbi:MAG TPA: 50S ribosomal protein L29 [Nevskiaceae bacterium]|nr:50S ribosomal protein L29 [Nevskiaceae bacterium]
MKKKEISQLHAKTSQELKILIKKMEEELVRMKIDLGSGRLKDVRAVLKKRRDLARAKTVFRQKELNETS